MKLTLGIIVVTGPQLNNRRDKNRNRDRLPGFWKEKLNKGRAKGETSKLLEVVLEEKRREIIKEWINSGRIKYINSNVSSDKKVVFYPEGEE